jgi:hypothetical protein
MTEPFTFTSPERAMTLFLYVINHLQVDDHGLVGGHDLSDLNAAAFLCRAVKTIAIAPRDVLDVLMFNLADATEALLLTAVLPGNGDEVANTSLSA